MLVEGAALLVCGGQTATVSLRCMELNACKFENRQTCLQGPSTCIPGSSP